MTTDTTLAMPARNNGSGTIQSRNVTVGSKGLVCSTFDELWRMSSAISRSGLAPKGIQTPEAVFTAIQFGLEIGLTPMAALQSLAIVNGRPSLYGDAALALVRGSGLCEYYTEFASNDEVHSLAELLAVALEDSDLDESRKLKREIAVKSSKFNRDADDFGFTSISKRVQGINAVVRRFTIGNAKQAALFNKEGPWRQYRERMLMWRSRGFNLRDNFGDVLKGMRTFEEAMDAPIRFDEASSPKSVTSRTQTLSDKLTRKPVSEGQTFVPAMEAIESDAIEQSAASNDVNPDTGEVMPPDAAQGEQPSQAEEKPVLAEPPPGSFVSHAAFMEQMNHAAAEMRIPESVMTAGVAIAIPKAKQDKLTPAQRRQVWLDLCNGAPPFN